MEKLIVLVVDDDEPVRAVISAAAESFGCIVIAVASGETALDYLKKSAPDVVVSDYSMPGGMTGIDLLRAIRSDPGLKAIPFILATGGGITKSQAMEAGCNVFLAKPVSLSVLEAALKEVLPG